MVEGRSVFTFINRAIAWGKSADRPMEVNGFKAKKKDIKKQDIYKQAWFDEILPQLIRENQALKKDLTAELTARIKYIESIFPLPPDPEENEASTTNNATPTSTQQDEHSLTNAEEDDELDFVA